MKTNTLPIQIHTFKLGINRCYVVKQHGAIMIDAGPPKNAGKLQKMLLRKGIDPEEISLIILTHGDFDHIGSAGDIREMTGAKVAIHRNDLEKLEKGIFNWPPGTTPWGRFSHRMFRPMLKTMAVPETKADMVIGDDDFPLEEYGIDGRIVYTPGHTSGHLSVVLNDGNAFVGCLAHNHFLFRFKPGLPIYADDIGQVRESWKKVIDMGARVAWPGHGDAFPVETIRKYL
jgi:glyoxylase-like metal-dependent hydrolase (beta-lactamase superfamily II)